MALLTTYTIVNAGTAPTLVAASASDTLTYAAGLFAYYENTGTAKTVTVIVPGTDAYGENPTDHALTLGATTGRLWIPIRPIARDSTTGLVTITLSSATAVTVAIVRLI